MRPLGADLGTSHALAAPPRRFSIRIEESSVSQSRTLLRPAIGELAAAKRSVPGPSISSLHRTDTHAARASLIGGGPRVPFCLWPPRFFLALCWRRRPAQCGSRKSQAPVPCPPSTTLTGCSIFLDPRPEFLAVVHLCALPCCSPPAGTWAAGGASWRGLAVRGRAFFLRFACWCGCSVAGLLRSIRALADGLQQMCQSLRARVIPRSRGT